jgi:uncharacterized membrane protein
MSSDEGDAMQPKSGPVQTLVSDKKPAATPIGPGPSAPTQRVIAPTQGAAQLLAMREEFTASMRSGPLPAPDELAAYGQVSPDLVDRIVKMAEKQADHRRQMERDVLALEKLELQTEAKLAQRGQLFGLIIGIVALIASGVAFAFNHEVGGTILGSADLIGLVAVFVLGRRASADSSKAERESDEQQQQQQPSGLAKAGGRASE